MLGLPDTITTCLFDLDGVLTDTASVHRTAWKQMFDAYLETKDGKGFQPFTDDDYNKYVDGKPRQDGVRDFLKSRDIQLPDGSQDIVVYLRSLTKSVSPRSPSTDWSWRTRPT